jgi:hypothetical protein
MVESLGQSIANICRPHLRVMAFVIFGSLYPAPPYPFNLLPYIFAAYMLSGAAWFGWLRRTAPTTLIVMERDMEEVGAS